MKEVVITRVFKARRETVFKAWTDPTYLMRWFAPHGCNVHFERLELRQGGVFHSRIHNPTFGDCWCIGVYKEITPNERLVYTMATADERGNVIPAKQAGHDPEWPTETTVTVTFEDFEGKTKVTLTQSVSEAVAKRTGAHPSWIQMLDRLEEVLPQIQE